MSPIPAKNIRWSLKQIHNSSSRSFDINQTDNYMVGRNQTAQITLNSNKVSRSHSYLFVNIENHLLVQDLRTVNGTFVNGIKIPVFALHRVLPGDTISFGVANISIAENDRDRQTFFQVLYKEPITQDTAVVELADSTNEQREHMESMSSNQSSGKNTTAELRLSAHESSFESPSTSKKDNIEVISIASSGDEQPNVDSFEENTGLKNIKISNVFSVPSTSPLKTKTSPTTWIQKSPTARKSARPKQPVNILTGDSEVNKRKSDNSNPVVESTVRTSTECLVTESTGTPGNINRRGSICAEPSTSKSISTSNLTKDGVNKMDTMKKKVPSDDHTSSIQNKAVNRRHSICIEKPEINTSKKVLSVEILKDDLGKLDIKNGKAPLDDHNTENTIDTESSSKEAKRVSRRRSSVKSKDATDSSTKTDDSKKDNKSEKNSRKQKDRSSEIDKDNHPKKENKLEKNSTKQKDRSNEIDKHRDLSGKYTKKSIERTSKPDLTKSNSTNQQSVGNKNNKHVKSTSVECKPSTTKIEDNQSNNDKPKKDLNKNSSKKSNILADDELLQQLDQVISGDKRDVNNKTKRDTESKHGGDQEKEKCNKKEPEVRQKTQSKMIPSGSHKKIKLDGGGEFSFSDSKVNEDDVKSKNNFKKDEVGLFKDPNFSLDNTFTMNRDNSIIIDITDEDEMNDDISNSQIFHMSQMVKTEVQDDVYLKIKNELAEMDFFSEGAVINQVPINLDDDLDGFENTQDIYACLEDGIEEKRPTDNDNLISNEENEELLKVLEDKNLEVDPMDVSTEDDSSATLAERNPDKVVKQIKPKYVTPPVIEPQHMAKSRKEPATKEDGTAKATKRKLSSSASKTQKKKLKTSPNKANIGAPPRCDAKSIQMEFKKRHSGSKVDTDRLDKDTIREERRKKLKEITERTPPTKKDDEPKPEKGNTVKVLPDSKTRRGSFLCEPAYTKPLPAPPPPRRSKTPNKELLKYKLKPLDLPDEAEAPYNLRRTKSSGDIRTDLKMANPLPPSSVQTRYNLRHSTALENNMVLMPGRSVPPVDPRTGRGILFPPPPAPLPLQVPGGYGPPPRQPPHYQVPPPQQQHVLLSQNYPVNPVSTRALQDSRRLMYTNGGPNTTRRPPPRRLPVVDDVVTKMVHWLPNWLLEQVDNDCSAPINNPPAAPIPVHFRSFEQYQETFSKLVLLENWQYIFKGFREGSEDPHKVKIEHVRVTNNLMTLDCVCYITQTELKKGSYYRPEDFLLLEYFVKDKQNHYVSLSFGFVQKCKKSTISDNDIIVVRLGNFCQGEPHTKLEFTVVTRYQPNKDINTNKFPVVKLLANIRGHLMLIRAIKGLEESPLCAKILHPKIREYSVFAGKHADIVQQHSLNPRQKQIVLEAASLCTGNSPGIYCIKGPPGTGKSTVIVNLIFQIIFSHCIKKNIAEAPMILLAAPSNTAVDNLLSKLTSLKQKLTAGNDKFKGHVKCVRIGPVSSISKECIGYSLPKLAEQHVPIKNLELPEFRAARAQKNTNMAAFAKKFFGDRYNHEVKQCEDLVIAKSNIICTTLNSCINGKLIEAVNRGLIKFSCCIIDEATQCHEVEALLPTILGINKFVFVGDPKQLNATIMNRDAYKLGFGESLFSRISNNFTNDPRTPIKMLTDQYRMHEEICAFPNKQFYEGKLRSFPKPPNKIPEQIRPYLVFNCEKISDSTDYTNMDEVNLIKKLLSTLFDLIGKNLKFTVGIITPYNAQKDLINSSIADLHNAGCCRITVNTVDSFQGSENDIVIISCVRDSTNSFLQNPNRLNVALTRAKQALYIIGNYTLFKECRPLYDLREDAKKRRLLLDIKQNPQRIDNFKKYLIKKV